MTDRDDTPQIFGGVPRANLMPPEMGAAKREASARRTMRFVIIVVAILVAVAVAASFYFAQTAESSYSQAQKESEALAGQKLAYADTIKLNSNVALGEASVKVGGSTDIEWGPYLQQLRAVLPDSVTIQTVDIDSENATTAYQQSTVPLDGKRIGTLTITGTTPTLPVLSDWIDGLSKLPGFVDATPGKATLGDGDTSGYVATVTMHLDEGAFSQRFAKTTTEADK